MKQYISPSIMCADWMNFGSTIRDFEANQIDYIHMDIMDGEFVPNYTLGTDLVKQLHKHTEIPLDIHLMCVHPEIKIHYFEVKKQDILTFHIEAAKQVQTCIDSIHSLGCKAGIAISPDTRIEAVFPYVKDIEMVTIMSVYPGFAGQKLLMFTLDKVKKLREYCDEQHIDIMIEVDGNVSFEHASTMHDMGANVYVAGSSSVFAKGTSIKENINHLRSIIETEQDNTPA